ncbi:MAG: MlaD family protein [Dysgonamonadaceae bacterium]|jgi:phospholipid/cholesterol/gamma-HCH transport system substrate-binding protein|nr:MlaD family protein [Dysgonamonadaceae bacterium]
MKRFFSKELTIGLVTAVSLVILYIGINYLKGVNIFKPANHYYVRMEKVDDLHLSSPVYVNGFKIGVVNGVDFRFDEKDFITVQVNLDKQMKIETGSYFELKSGLTSGAYLDLHLNKYVETYCSVGDTLEGFSTPGMMDKISGSLLPQVEIILPRLDSILQGIQLLVNHPALSQSLKQISATTAALANSSQQLNQILAKDVHPILSNLNQTAAGLAVFSNKIQLLDLDLTLNKVNGALENINRLSKQMNNKDNSLGLLLNDRSLYDHLDSTAMNASQLLLDFKLNPKRYVQFSIF